MHFPTLIRTVALIVATTLLVPQTLYAQHSRITPEVQAVQKTKDAIVTLKVMFRSNYGNSKPVFGSGVIVDERGYLVTNAHVVGNNSEATVILWDGTELKGKVFATDPANDIAIVKLPGDRTYKELRLAPSSDLLHAERIIAVGNPFGYIKTVTTGSISGLDRVVNMDGVRLTGLIQIDAPINPGNSGGPVLNINGELIALVVAVREGAQGIAFAIPSDQVEKVLSRHLGARQVSRVDHGLRVESKVVRPEGEARSQVVVQQVATPEGEDGVKSRDVILKVAGRVVTNSFDLERSLWNANPTASVQASVLRDGQVRNVAIYPTHR